MSTRADLYERITFLERQNGELLFCLRSILADLPKNRDWLNPDIEKLARETIAKAEEGK